MAALEDKPEIMIEEWRTDASPAALIEMELAMLAEILHAVVHGGASVSFLTPFSMEEARSFWVDKILPQARAGKRRVLLARWSGKIVGTVQIDLDMPPNQAHRAGVEKMLVHPNIRRRGIARALMTALEEMAQSAGRTLLTLDTVTDSPAQALYRSLGYVTVGVIPGYARGALSRELEGTTIMYKQVTRSNR